MNVTFFENHSYYKSELQGENINESHLWDSIPSVNTLSPDTNQSSHTQPSGVHDESPFISTPSMENSSHPSFMAPSPFQEPTGKKKFSCIHEGSNQAKTQSTLHTTHLQDYHKSEPGQSGNSKHDNVDHKDDLDIAIALRKGVYACTEHPIGNFVSYKTLSPSYQAFISAVDNIQIPHTIQEALADSQWKEAVQNEINALVKNNTWTLTNLPPGKKTVGCKWVFSVKHKADGSIERFKARFVAKGFTQSYGIDYQETFAPVAKVNTIHVLLSLVANKDWALHQLDIKNAFLNGDLEEEVYMNIPPGFENSLNREKVCKLKKSLYGLKQSPRAWFGRFTKSIIQNGYTQCQADHTLFVRFSSDKRISILIVYVDDIILTGDYVEEIERLKHFLSREFEIKELGNLRYFLGMGIIKTRYLHLPK